MRTHVVIHDHLAKVDHTFTWFVEGCNLAAVMGAVHASFVRFYGSSAGRIDVRDLDANGDGCLYAKGMFVDVASISDQVPLLSHIDAERRREQRAIAHDKAVAA